VNAVLPRADFGRTGHVSTRVVFGAAALGAMRQERADAVLDTLLEFGVDHLDTAASYGDAELRLAPWLARHPAHFFLATKTGERTGDGARAELERSLERLGVDRVDLIQLHNLVEPDEWEVAHGPGGAVEALLRARDDGLCRFVGVTGHGLRIAAMHRRSLERADLDSVLFPWNFTLSQLPAYRAEVEALLDTCAERDVAVQTIKSVARGRWPDGPAGHFSWYEPVTDLGAVDRAVRFVLGHDGSDGRPPMFLNSSSDARLLHPILEAAVGYGVDGRVPTDDELRADAESFGITPLFDGGALERI
jgi:aryl-alcohol dehydrogenase-like predicted oxidoreductase